MRVTAAGPDVGAPRYSLPEAQGSGAPSAPSVTPTGQSTTETLSSWTPAGSPVTVTVASTVAGLAYGIVTSSTWVAPAGTVTTWAGLRNAPPPKESS